ncbi:hypothetical protein HFO49_28370 [Rhizobium leguminosarum]|uniref:hypothetical protein n=1 Tax=Rhizobium leguminosarum TaxID=384 RepID=UPI001C97301F|nr:hypothetical protein [Rhizobium leguminosarum]MBY5591336.1 hypothetical protein [Rhizobium leguminosarum]MBY5604997.1 hypothetical protein [Rhizobium leguminosarum]
MPSSRSSPEAISRIDMIEQKGVWPWVDDHDHGPPMITITVHRDPKVVVMSDKPWKT